MKQYNMCPKKVFDDIYIHILQQDSRGVDVQQESQAQWDLIDGDHDHHNQLRTVLFRSKDKQKFSLD